MNPYGNPPGHYGGPPQYGHHPQQGYAPAPYPGGGHHAHPPAPTKAPDPDRGRRTVGLVMWIVGMLAGVVLNLLFTAAEIVFSKNPDGMLSAMFIGALFAFPPLLIYLSVPTLLDRYDPEPWWCLAMAFLWGAVVATGFSGFINTGVGMWATAEWGRATGEIVGAAVSAPIVEEFWKGLAILGFFYFLRREFDGIVDGIIYATFCALGFAAVENVIYYGRAAFQGGDVLAMTVVLRGGLTPWLHPVFTVMTGIGFGIARETTSTALKWIAPIGGYLIGVALHAVWNFLPTALGPAFGVILVPWLGLWFLFVAFFFILIIALVVRKGRVIRDNLRDEVLIGNLSQQEVDLICSPVGRLRCTFSWRGATGKAFIRSGARLALSKWHTARAMRGQKRTISADFIVPLRQDLAKLRRELMAKAPQQYGHG